MNPAGERRKLIEVAVPLEAINAACKADKDRKTGTIRNLHKWFAPMPTPAWRALLFASLVDDPGDEAGRQRLWGVIEELVASGPDSPPPQALTRAREALHASNPDGLPMLVDPFCGGGSTLIEAQRLGLPTFGSDLNPVAVLITRMLCELLPVVAGQGPIAAPTNTLGVGGGAFEGFAADVRHYAQAIRDEVRDQIGQLYPAGPGGERIVAWLWARTVRCPNPACGIEAPLATSWWLSKRKGEEAWIQPNLRNGHVEFSIGRGRRGAPDPPKVGRGANFVCVGCGTTVDEEHVQTEGRGKRLDTCLTAIVAQDGKRRVYLPPTNLGEVEVDRSFDLPDVPIADIPRWFSPPLFGFTTQADLFTRRQLVALDTFARAVAELPDRIRADGADDRYATAITTFLGLCVSKLSQSLSTQVRWKIDSRNGTGKGLPAFARHDVPMLWDFVECNPFGGSVGDWLLNVETAMRAIPFASTDTPAEVHLRDARTVAAELPQGQSIVATDPPYFAHIGYADLSDYFYVWLRRALRDVQPDLFATVMAPRDGELIALANRHGGDRAAAHEYFVRGFTDTFASLNSAQRPDLPMLVVYAHREEHTQNGRGGWEAMLDAILRADFAIVGTLPLHGTGAQRMIGLGANALATYVVMVCRPRHVDAPRISRRDLDPLMRDELRIAVTELQQASIAPVDLAQAVIGPGMAIFSRYAAVLEADGSAMSVGNALHLINRILGEVLEEQETDLDPDSRWASTWFEQHGYEPARFGEADALARAKGIAVDSLVRAGIVDSGGNNVRLLRPTELPSAWDPAADSRPTAWEAVHHLARTLDGGGEQAAGQLWAKLGSLADPARELAYRLFQICERRGMTAEAVALNALVADLPEIARLAPSPSASEQTAIF